MKAGLAPGEAVYFLDARHPTRATKIGYSWSLRGGRKAIKTWAGQERVNVVGSLDPATLRLVTTFPAKVNGASLSKHLAKLRRLSKTDAKIHVILDNGSYCRSHAARGAAAALGIERVHLPPYSPNLNLIERMWRLMNERVRDNVSFPSAKAFEDAIKKFFQKRWPRISKNFKSRFAENFQSCRQVSF